jgi:hypothetical protein
MLTPRPSTDSWREALKFINKCPICSSSYALEEARLFGKHDSASFVHLTCPTCQSYFVAMIVMLGQGFSSVGMVTDLSLGDAERLYAAEPITVNEVIGGFKVIQNTQFFNSLILK